VKVFHSNSPSGDSYPSQFTEKTMLAKSTLTASAITKQNSWVQLQNPLSKGVLKGKKLQALTANQLTVDSSATMLYLNGLVYQNQNAHITITPDGMGEWTYFHLTIVGQESKAYYQLEISDSEYEYEELIVKKANSTNFNGKSMKVSAKENYWTDVPQEVSRDIQLIMECLINKEYVKGEAVAQ
jgi:hypothetical protein